MMTVPMDNNSVKQAPSKELVQRLYSKNIELENKRRKSAQARVPSDPNAWQQMRENYEAIILEDHAFSEKHEIEYALWQLHYRRIEELRAHFSAALASAGSAAPGGKGPPRPDRIKKIRSQFKTFLSEATGFYHDLILKIRAKYGLPFGHFAEDPQALNTAEKDGKKNSEMKRGLMSCHRCLIYLGDLARYKGLYGEGDSKTRDYAAASSYYMQAASLWPSSGNPHHQLAILASYSGDDLGSIYRYFRSLAVNNPFTTARDNLIIAFEKNRQSYSQLTGDPKIPMAKTVASRKTVKGRGNGEIAHPPENIKLETTSTKESTANISETYKAFCVRFVRLNGILFTRTSLETFSEVFSFVRRDMKELLSSGPEEQFNFGTDSAENGLVIVRLVAILIFTVHNVNREVEGQSYAEILQRSVLLQNAFTAAFEIMGRILERSIQLHDPSSSYLLPAILVFIEWLACRPDIAAGSDMEEKQATARSLFWNHCILFLNKLLSSKFISVAEDEDETCFFNMSRYDERETDNRLALWEDFELRGFQPLLPAQLILDFSRSHMTGNDGSGKETRIRIQRILAAGRVLANNGQTEEERIYFDQKLKKFIFGIEPQKTDDFILPTTFEMSKSNGISQDNPLETRNTGFVPAKVYTSQDNPLETRNTGFVPAKVTVYTEGEEEDEEIVFKPTISEKLADVPTSKLPAYEVTGSAPTATVSEWESYAGSTSAPLSKLNLQSGFDANNQYPVASFGMSGQNHQPVISGVSNWLSDQQAYLVNGVNNLNVSGNGFTGNGFVSYAELKDGFDSSKGSVLPHSFPKSVDLSNSSVFPTAPDAVIPSKFDSVMSTGFYADSISLNPLSASQASSKKSPVSRPVRHIGPPPGFRTVPPKQLDNDKVGTNLRDENPLVDDYSWLDGYHLSSSAKGITSNNSINPSAHMYPHGMNDNNSLTGSINFPFPGKQVSANQVQDESQKIWHDHQLIEQLKLYQQQQQHQPQQHQPQQVNHTSSLLPEHYQGQSLWSNSFFV